MWINEIAVPINTILIVEIIGVTLFFDTVENKKHREETVIIIIFEIKFESSLNTCINFRRVVRPYYTLLIRLL